MSTPCNANAATTAVALDFVTKIATKMNAEKRSAAPSFALSMIEMSDANGMVCCAEKLLAAQREFRRNGAPAHVDVGYHYCRAGSLQGIEAHGLMTRAELNALYGRRRGLHHPLVARYGDGIYTGNNPHAGRGHGDVGLLVARLKGSTVDLSLGSGGGLSRTGLANVGLATELCILRQSCQCVVLARFPTSMLNGGGSGSSNTNERTIYQFHCLLQAICDECFNPGQPAPTAVVWNTTTTATAPAAPAPSFGAGAATAFPTSFLGRNPFTFGGSSGAASSAPPFGAAPSAVMPSAATPFGATPFGAAPCRASPFGATPSASQPPSSRRFQKGDVVTYVAPDRLSPPGDGTNLPVRPVVRAPAAGTECVVCLEALTATSSAAGEDRVVALKTCGHEFHARCIRAALRSSNKCPSCRKPVGEPTGTMPSGTMTVSRKNTTSCRGYERFGCIVVTYNIPAAVQKSYHEHPGVRHGSARREAYLPDNDDGRKLLARLRYAFAHGLTFTVGTSLTSNAPDQVTWSSIHHKTSLSPGPHGYPDAGYFLNCHDELDAAGVPPAEDCVDCHAR